MTQLLDYDQWFELNKDRELYGETFGMLPATAEQLKRVRGFVDAPVFEYEGVYYNCMSLMVPNPDQEEDKEFVHLSDNIPWEDVVVYKTTKTRSVDPVKAAKIGIDHNQLFFPETISEADLEAIRCVTYKVRIAIIGNDRYKA